LHVGTRNFTLALRWLVISACHQAQVKFFGEGTRATTKRENWQHLWY